MPAPQTSILTEADFIGINRVLTSMIEPGEGGGLKIIEYVMFYMRSQLVR